MTEAGQCRVPGCGRPIKVLKESLCGLHYARLRRHGDPEAWKKPVRPECSVDGCTLRAVGHGLCDMHYRRLRRHGVTDDPAPRPTICAVAGCGGPVSASALCDRHYRRAKKGQGDRHCRLCGAVLDPNSYAGAAFCDDTCRKQDQVLKRRENHREVWLRRYGLTVEQFDALLEQQSGGCAICRTTTVPTRGNWHVDHCHETGRVRGILCHGCNVALGHLKDRIDLLEAAIAYLRK